MAAIMRRLGAAADASGILGRPRTKEQRMGGFFGVASRNDCVSDVFYGTDYHSHLGTRRGGMVTSTDAGFKRNIHDITNSPFRTKFEDELPKHHGNFGPA
jgi:amidophosphoribosyltransferase